DSGAAYDKNADRAAFAKQRHAQMGAEAPESLGLQQTIVGVVQNIGNLNRSSLKQHPSHDAFTTRCERERAQIFVVFGRVTITGRRIETMLPLPWTQNLRLVGPAKPCCRLDQGFEDGVQIEGRTADRL